MSKHLKGNRIYVVAVLGVVVLAGLGYLGYIQYSKMNTSPEAVEAKKAEEVAEVVVKVKKLMIVPEETPVMAKVENAEQLKSQQAFFAGAQDGDVVLIFPQAAKAVIYSPSRGLIVNSGPVQNQETPAAQTPAPTEVKAETKK